MAPYATLTWHGEIYVLYNENIKQYTVKFLKEVMETAFWTYKGCQTKNFKYLRLIMSVITKQNYFIVDILWEEN